MLAVFCYSLRSQSILNRKDFLMNSNLDLDLLNREIDELINDPKGEAPFYDLGVELMGRGIFIQAARLLNQAVVRGDRAIEACANLSYVYYQLKDLEKLLAAAKMAVQLEPDNAKAYASLGFIYLEMSRTRDAVIALEKALEIDKKCAQAWSNLITAYIQKKDLDKAIEIGREMVAFAPDNSIGINNLGYAFFLKEDFAQAIVWMDRARELGLEIHPEFYKKLETYRRTK
jgi:tetratricopeptide (TPR) repeat protein